jgi:3-oxoacyl-(acyl-carrier-protein) synthase
MGLEAGITTGEAQRSSFMSDTLLRRVVVTGMGVVSPAGNGVAPLWKAILEGRSAEQTLPELDCFGMKSKIFGRAGHFDPYAEGIDASFIERNDRYACFAFAAAREAISQSALFSRHFDPERVGVNVATAIAGTETMEQGFLQVTGHAAHPVQPYGTALPLYQAMCPSTASVEIAAHYGFLGPCVTTSTGCTAGLDSIGYAWHCLRNNEADVMIAGAAEAPLCPISVSAFDIIQALTRKPVSQVGMASSPFSSTRDGFVLAEGSGIVVLEELEHARRRGASIYAELVGYGSTCNAYHMTGLPADGIDLSRAINLALHQAQIDPSQVDYINAHGSSTQQNDRNETAAFHRSFKGRAPFIPISSIKSLIGHPLGAASSIEFVVCVEAINHNFLPPTINYTPAADCDLDYVPNQGRNGRIDVVLTDASGFSGLHSVAVLRRYPQGSA